MRRSSSRGWFGSWVVGAALLGGCEPEPPAVTTVQGRFEIAPDFEGPICAGNLAHMEERLAWLEQALGLAAPETIRFHWLTGDNPFCQGHGACAGGGTIYGPWASFDHELVHVVLSSLGRAHPFLEEGMAVAFSEDLALDRLLPSQWLDDKPSDFEGVDNQEFYATAGHFVRFLHDVYGVEKLIALYRRSDYYDGPAGFREDFLAVYGVSFDDIEAAYVDTAWVVYPPPYGCPEPDLEWDGAVFGADLELDCEDPRVVRNDDSYMERVATLELPSPRSGLIRVDGAPQLLVRSCRAAPGDLSESFHGRLDAGRHSVRIATELEAPRTVRVEFDPFPGV